MYPSLKNFKEFVRGLDPNVDEVSACKQFKEFKTNLMRVGVDKFFDEHKHEEWFKNKYHPQDSLPNNIIRELIFTRRCQVYHDLLKRGHFDKFIYNVDYKQAILNTLNAVVILLDDGPVELAETLLQAGNNKAEEVSDELHLYLPKTPNCILLENLNINTTISDVETVCRKTGSNLKYIAFLDPYYIKGGELRHRILLKFGPQVDIRETCWKLGRSQINGQNPNAFICLIPTNRFKSVDATTNHKLTVVKDIRNAIQIILNFDELRGLYGRRKNDTLKEKILENNGIKKEILDESITENHNEDIAYGGLPPSPPGSEKSIESFDISSLDQDREKEKKKLLDMKFNFDLSYRKIAKKILKSQNPLMSNALDYLTDYTRDTCLTYQLSKISSDLIHIDRSIEEPTELKIELLIENLPYSHEENVKTLDKLLWYLRIVHSYDYYNMRTYKQEDDMPLKLTFIHVRDTPSNLTSDIDIESVKEFNATFDTKLKQQLKQENQTYLTKEEERYTYRSYKKNIQNELESYAERIPNPKKNNETVDAYKCKHCTKMFQKLQNVGLHFVSKHREAIDFIEMETDFFNTYLFDTSKIDPKPSKKLLDVFQNKFVAELNQLSKQVSEESNLLRETIEIYKKLEPAVLQEAPRKIIEDSADPRVSEMDVDYEDISFDDAL